VRRTSASPSGTFHVQGRNGWASAIFNPSSPGVMGESWNLDQDDGLQPEEYGLAVPSFENVPILSREKKEPAFRIGIAIGAFILTSDS
jgi:hypothetical protein